MPSNHLILCHPLLLPPSIFPSIRVFSNESVLHIRWKPVRQHKYPLMYMNFTDALMVFLCSVKSMVEKWQIYICQYFSICTPFPSPTVSTSPFSTSAPCSVQLSSVAQLCPTLSNPMNCSTPGLPVARPPCPSPALRVYSNSCPLSQWCHPTTSSSVVPFSSHLQSFPASGFFQMSQLFVSGGQSIGVSASTSVLPVNSQDWFPSGWTGWISLQSKGFSRVFSNTIVQKHQFFSTQFKAILLSSSI